MNYLIYNELSTNKIMAGVIRESNYTSLGCVQTYAVFRNFKPVFSIANLHKPCNKNKHNLDQLLGHKWFDRKLTGTSLKSEYILPHVTKMKFESVELQLNN